MRSPTLIELRFLESAARAGSFSRAARELGVTQQAVSARIRELERLLGFALLIRTPAGVAPTPEGDAVLAGGRDVLAALDRLDDSIAGLRHDASGRVLRVGASQTVSAHLLPDWLVAFRRARERDGRPLPEVSLRTANSTRIIALVRTGELDLGFIETPEAPRGLGTAVVGRDRMVVAVSPAHPWAMRPTIALGDVAVTPLVTREAGSGTRDALEAALCTHLAAAPAAPVVALGTEAAVRSAVAQGDGPAVLSERTVRDDVQLGRLVGIPLEPPLTRPFTAIWRGTDRDLASGPRELVALAASS